MCIEENKNEWIVKDDFNEERIDYWLKKNIPNISYPILCKFIRKGIVRINGKRTKNSHILNTGDIVKFSRQVNIHSAKIIKGNYDKKFSGFIDPDIYGLLKFMSFSWIILFFFKYFFEQTADFLIKFLFFFSLI